VAAYRRRPPLKARQFFYQYLLRYSDPEITEIENQTKPTLGCSRSKDFVEVEGSARFPIL